MRKGIATVSVSGVLADKLDGRSRRPGFDGVEIFDNDLVASPLSPREVARPVRRPRPARSTSSSRCATSRASRPSGSTPCCTGSRAKLDVMAELGADDRAGLLATSAPTPSTTSTSRAEQLHRARRRWPPSTA